MKLKDIELLENKRKIKSVVVKSTIKKESEYVLFRHFDWMCINVNSEYLMFLILNLKLNIFFHEGFRVLNFVARDFFLNHRFQFCSVYRYFFHSSRKFHVVHSDFSTKNTNGFFFMVSYFMLGSNFLKDLNILTVFIGEKLEDCLSFFIVKRVSFRRNEMVLCSMSSTNKVNKNTFKVREGVTIKINKIVFILRNYKKSDKWYKTSKRFLIKSNICRNIECAIPENKETFNKILFKREL